MSEPDTVDAAEQRKILKSLWRPHPGQRAIMETDARFRIVACGRRWGKSEMAAHLALERALEEPSTVVWWVGPTFDDANDFGYDKIKPLVSPDILDGEPKRTKPRKIELINGSEISFRSAEREDSLRGGGVDFLIIDESASIASRAWTDELRPTLSDTLGDMIAIGTPKGRNWFHDWFRRGQSPDHPDVASWQAPTTQNPHVPDSEVDAAKEDVPERVFRQEYLAEFVDDAGGVFEKVRERIVAQYDYEAEDGTEPYSIGVDFARMSDYTVIIALDSSNTLVAFERLRGVTWPQIQSHVERIHGRYPGTMAVDATRDNKIVSDLESAGVPVDPVKFSTSKKQDLIENLVTQIEQEALTIPDIPPLVSELQMFEYETTPAGNVRYHAPSGHHDDCVDALALAAQASRSNNNSVSIVSPRTTKTYFEPTTGHSTRRR